MSLPHLLNFYLVHDLDVKLFTVETQTQWLFQIQKKIGHLILLNIKNLLFIAKFHPLHFKVFRQVGEVLNWIIRINIIFLKILHQDQNKQVQHNILLHQYKGDKEKNADPIYY